MRSASAAEAAADKLRNERRDAKGILESFWLAMAHLVAAILPQNGSRIRLPIPSLLGAGSSLNPRESLCPLGFRLPRTATEDSDGKEEFLESKPQPRFRDNLR